MSLHRMRIYSRIIALLLAALPVDVVARDLLNMDLATLMTIQVGPSADASAKGLSAPYAGHQVADGGRVGILGTLPVMDAAFSVTSYTRRYIRNQQAASVGDVLQYDPTVRVTRGFGNFQQVYWIRGLPLFSDDMAYNGLYGILPRQYLSTQLVERVEILRGANAVLNGAAPSSSGLGGAVNVMPKRAPKTDLNRVYFGINDGGLGYMAADVARRSDDQRFGLRMNVLGQDGDTNVKGESNQLGLGTIGADYIGDRFRISADLGYQSHHMNATTPSITIADGLPIPKAPDASSAIAQPWTFSKEQDVFATLRTEYDVSSDITGWLAMGMRHGDEDSRLSAFLRVNDTTGNFSANRFDVEHDDDVSTGEVGLHIRFATGSVKHRFTLSANGYQNKGHNAYAVYDSFTSNLYRPVNVAMPTGLQFGGGDLNSPRVTDKVVSSSAAAVDQIRLLDDSLLLALGARYQTIRHYNYDYDSGQQQSRYSKAAVTPLATLVYHISQMLSAYANVIEGLQRGDTAPATNSSGAVANAGASLSPYHVKQTELGLKYQDGTLGSTLSVFRIRKPLAGYDSNNALVKLDQQTNRGLELLIYGEPVSGLRVLGGVSLLDADAAGDSAVGCPRHQGNLNLEWDVPQLSHLTLTAQMMETGSQYADSANTQKVPAWHRLDLGARYRMPLDTGRHLTIRARLSNVANSNYWASAGGYPGAGYLTLGAPRTLSIATNLTF